MDTWTLVPVFLTVGLLGLISTLNTQLGNVHLLLLSLPVSSQDKKLELVCWEESLRDNVSLSTLNQEWPCVPVWTVKYGGFWSPDFPQILLQLARLACAKTNGSEIMTGDNWALRWRLQEPRITFLTGMSQPCSCYLLHNYHYLTNSSPLLIRKIASEGCRFHPRDASVHFCCLQPGHISLSQYSPRGWFVFTFCHVVQCSACYCSQGYETQGKHCSKCPQWLDKKGASQRAGICSA